MVFGAGVILLQHFFGRVSWASPVWASASPCNRGYQSGNRKVIDMAELKTKTATKKVAAKSTSTAEGKTATAGVRKTAAVKKSVAVKKPAAAKKPTARKTDCESCHDHTNNDHGACGKTLTVAAKKKSVASLAAGTSGKAVAAHQGVAKTNPEMLYSMVETAAYFIAEQQGFQGHSHDHWLAAEREIAAKLGCSADVQHQPVAA